MKNFNIKSTIISETVRVSSAAIFYDSMFDDYFQYETWIFSKEPGKSRQIIHGTCGLESERLKKEAEKIHDYIVNNLKEKKPLE